MIAELPFHTAGNHEVRRNETFANIVTLTTFWGTRVPVDGSEEPMMPQFSDLPLIGRMKNQRLIRYASLARLSADREASSRGVFHDNALRLVIPSSGRQIIAQPAWD